MTNRLNELMALPELTQEQLNELTDLKAQYDISIQQPVGTTWDEQLPPVEEMAEQLNEQPPVEDRRTPDQWLAEEFSHLRVVNPTGWNINNPQGWAVEWTIPLLKEEFMDKLQRSVTEEVHTEVIIDEPVQEEVEQPIEVVEETPVVESPVEYETVENVTDPESIEEVQIEPVAEEPQEVVVEETMMDTTENEQRQQKLEQALDLSRQLAQLIKELI